MMTEQKANACSDLNSWVFAGITCWDFGSPHPNSTV
jgi:hypothetical protein